MRKNLFKTIAIVASITMGVNANAQVEVDDPYAMRKIWIDIDPANFDFHAQNFLNVNFGLRGTYHLNGKTSVYSDFYISYFDINKYLIKSSEGENVKRFFSFETHLSYDLINRVKVKNVNVLIGQTSNYNDAYWSNSDKYTVTSTYITVPAKIRKTISLHTSVNLFRSSIMATDDFDKRINFKKIGDIPDSLRYFSSSKVNGTFFQPVLSAGISFKKILNVKVRYGGATSLFFNNLYNSKNFDLLFAPFHSITNSRNGDKLKAVDFKYLGWRFSYELRPFQKGKDLNSSNLARKVGLFYKFELGQRPGIKGYRAFFNFGMGWRLLDK